MLEKLLLVMEHDVDTRDKESELEEDLPDYDMDELMHRVMDVEEVREMMDGK